MLHWRKTDFTSKVSVVISSKANPSRPEDPTYQFLNFNFKMFSALPACWCVILKF